MLDTGNARAVQRYAGMSRAYQFDGDTGPGHDARSRRWIRRVLDRQRQRDQPRRATSTTTSRSTPRRARPRSAPTPATEPTTATSPASGFQPGYVSIRADNTATARAGRTASPRSSATAPTCSRTSTGRAERHPGAFRRRLSDRLRPERQRERHHELLPRVPGQLGRPARRPASRPSPARPTPGSIRPTRPRSSRRDNALRVRSKNAQNRRALDPLHPAPAPAGCVVKSAKLSLNASTRRGGRTLHAGRDRRGVGATRP